MLSRFVLVGAAAATLAPVALGQLRIVEWNVTFYDGASARDAAFQTALYGTFQGRSLDPDVIVGEEFESAAGVIAFRNMLNAAPGSPGDWAAAPFTGGNSDSGLFYRSSKVQFVEQAVLSEGTSSDGPPRDNNRYLIRPVGTTGAGAGLYLYSAHMKAGDTSGDQQRRIPEAARIVADIATLPEDAGGFMLLGDYNIQDSSQQAYQILVNSAAGGGPLMDPIRTPGSWNNNSAYRFIHTQDPAGAGGMDDRHDQILIATVLDDGEGLDYLPGSPGGDTTTPYSMSGWNDPNHSYRSWGNDGTSFNALLATTGNTMVGATIAQALRTTAGNGGHLPVMLEVQAPARVDAPVMLDVGQFPVGVAAEVVLTVANGGDVALFSRDGTGWGIDDLDYALSGSPGVTAPGGSFSAAAGGAGNAHVIGIDTSVAGPIAGSVTIASDDPDAPSFVVAITGEVAGMAPCYCERGGAPDSIDVFDLLSYLDLWFAGDPTAEFSGDEPAAVDVFDLLAYLDCWFPASGGDCPPPPPPPEATGACCTGASCGVLTEADCGEAGGVYLGDDAACDGGVCALDGGVFISELVDGTLAAGNPKFVEITNRSAAPFTFAAGGVIVQSNSATDLSVDINLAGVTIAPGQSFVVASSANGGATTFEMVYGFAADLYSGAAFGNGNDRYILTDAADGSHLLDSYGEVGVDGMGTPWEYTDSYAVRAAGVESGNGGAFAPGEWTFGGPDALEGADDAAKTVLLQELTTPGSQ